MSVASLVAITEILLDESSSSRSLYSALDNFSQCCSDVTGIVPDRSFDGWAEDSFLDDGVAINPQAAAFCIKDYQRSVVFIRGVNAAINVARERFPDSAIKILYAGCGPFATLLLPLLVKYKPNELDIYLLDIHQQSLDSVSELVNYFGFNGHAITLIQGDACSYQHTTPLNLIIAETMQKSLEQEPQFAVTANLAPQLYPQGIFIPEKIEVLMCLAHWEREKETYKKYNKIDHESLINSGLRHQLGSIFTLLPEQAQTQMLTALDKGSTSCNQNESMHSLSSVDIQIPTLETKLLERYDALMLTRINVFGQYTLKDYESEITLPYKCYELTPLNAGDEYKVCYQLGKYPRFNLTRC